MAFFHFKSTDQTGKYTSTRLLGICGNRASKGSILKVCSFHKAGLLLGDELEQVVLGPPVCHAEVEPETNLLFKIDDLSQLPRGAACQRHYVSVCYARKMPERKKLVFALHVICTLQTSSSA